MRHYNALEILKELETFSEENRNNGFLDQAYNRFILSELQISKSEWPKFDEKLDIRLYYSTHYQIWKGLKLLETGEDTNKAQSYIKQGAEYLEYLYKINTQISDEIKIEVLFKSILAYYISGNHIAAYVLSKELNYFSELPPLLSLIMAIMNKNLKEIRLIISRVFTESRYKEENLINESVDIEEKLSRVIYYSTIKATSYFLEFLKSGSEELFEKALAIINTCVKFSEDLNYVDYWWWLYCLSFILIENYEKSLWKNLGFFEYDYLKPYVKNYLSHNPPITELWPSQIDSLRLINNEKRNSFCLKLPTSSGKTLIAELTILQFFSDFPNSGKKCIYIAPYRSLAAEIEKTLHDGLSSVGIKISEIYGDYEYNPAEELLVQESEVLVVTPEKFDVIFRYQTLNPENIGLIIIDEGHLINSINEMTFLEKKKSRNIRFEFLLHRLLNKLKDCRFLFISAVLPDPKNIAKWISGSPDQFLDKDWRPTRLRLGELIFTERKNLEIKYTKLNKKSLQTPQKKFIASIDLRQLSSTNRKKSFPNDANEALAMASLKFAKDGPTLVYAPKKNEVGSFANTILKVIKFQNSIAKEIGEDSLKLKIEENYISDIEKCKDIIRSEMNKNSPLIEYLENGFIIHHSDLPKIVRNSIENLLKKNAIRLIIATTTITAGVNLPIKTVLIKGLYQGHNETLDSMQFWNICGRAGRAGKENEGQALFLINKTEIINNKGYDKFQKSNRKHKKKLSIIHDITNGTDQNKFSSTIEIFLSKLIEMWVNKHPRADFNRLYDSLTENKFEWASDKEKDLTFWIDKLDSYLLDLSEESEEELTLNDLQNIISRSLYYILANKNQEFITFDMINQILKSRLNYINAKFPSPNIRRSIYQLGLSIPTFEIIEKDIKELDAIFLDVILWNIYSYQKRIECLVKISSLILKLEDIFKNMGIWNYEEWLPDQWEIILKYWLNGLKIDEMVKNEEIKLYSDDIVEIKVFIDKFCGEILPWGMNSIFNFYKSYRNIQEMPEIAFYMPNMIKYGILSPEAVIIMPYLDLDRDYSILLSQISPSDYKNPAQIVLWLKNLNLEELLEKNVDFETAQNILNIIKRSKNNFKEVKNHIIRFELNKKIINLKKRERMFLSYDDETNLIKLFTLNGKFIASTKYKNQFPQSILKSDVVDYFIGEIEHSDDKYTIDLVISDI